MVSVESSLVNKPKTQRGKRFLQSREAKMVEDGKKCMFIRGLKVGNNVIQLMKFLNSIKKDCSTQFHGKNDEHPFEDSNFINYFARKSDASTFAFGSSNKKRPDNIVFGRTYDWNLLDMYEFGVKNIRNLEKLNDLIIYSKPFIAFNGADFELNPIYNSIRNMFGDFFRGCTLDHLPIDNQCYLLQITVLPNKIISFNFYRIKKDNNKPIIVDVDQGFDLELRRYQEPDSDVFTEALKKPKINEKKRVKNITEDALHNKLGTVHMMKQDFVPLTRLKPVKALRKSKPKKK